MRLREVILLLCLACAVGAYSEGVPSDTIRQASICIGSQQILKASAAGDAYLWTKDGEPLPDDTRTIVITADAPATYVCSVTEKKVSAQYNLMANGDFEANPPTSFSSDYLYAGWNPYQYYSDHGGASNLYAITKDASYFWKDFYPVLPHGGEYFALFDAGKEGFAWKAETKDNPDLVLEKDSTYLFSYYAAYPNKDPNNSPARLQFVIQYYDAAGNPHEDKLGAEHTLGKTSPLNGWELQETRYTAKASSSSVMIGVYDNNQSEGGNDFCLDDIMFQKTTMVTNTVIHQTVFIVEPHDCTPPCPNPLEDVQHTVVCDTLLPYLWQGYTFTKPDTVEWIEYSPRGCDSILHMLVLDTVRCLPELPPPPVCYDDMVYAKWTDVLFCNNAHDRYVAYQWYCNNLPLSGETKQFLYFPDTNGVATPDALFHVCARTASGAEQCSCALPYAAFPRSADTYTDPSPVRLQCRNGSLVLTAVDASCYACQVFAPSGMLLLQTCLQPSETVLPVLPAGVYVLQVLRTGNPCWVQKIML